MYTLNEIFDYIKMPRECITLSLECLERHKDTKAFADMKKRFYDGEYLQEDIDAYAKTTEDDYRMVRLAFCLYCVDDMYALYKKNGLSDNVYLDSLIDLRVWALTCKRNYGYWGMEEFRWLQHSLRCKVIRMGRLQFERNEYEYGDDYDKHGYKIKHGDPAIGIHIPEDGRFTEEQRLDSLKQAYEYYKNPFFICESYLLYPPQYDFLKPESNIVKFMNEFDIVYYEENDRMQDMWRIFGLRESYDPKTLPRESSLQRGYAEHIERTGKNGWGYGLLIFDGERIITKK